MALAAFAAKSVSSLGLRCGLSALATRTYATGECERWAARDRAQAARWGAAIYKGGSLTLAGLAGAARGANRLCIHCGSDVSRPLRAATAAQAPPPAAAAAAAGCTHPLCVPLPGLAQWWTASSMPRTTSG